LREAAVIDAVVFDMDGLLLDTEPIYRLAWQRAAADFGRRIDDRVYFELIGRSTRDAEQVLAGIFGATFPLAEFRERWLVHWRDEVRRSGIPRKPGLEETLAATESLGLARAIATSTEAEDARFTLRLGGLDGRFDRIVTGDLVALGKPAPDIYWAAAAALGVPATRCVAFEDSDAGALAATAAGMRTVIVPDMKPPSSEARARAFRVIPSLEQAPALLRGLVLGREGPP
jgi:HAD superfamily hydrolase (TIGR01509 family)